MKKVLSHMFNFIKHLFLRLRLVITLNIGRSEKNGDIIDGESEEPPKKGD